MDRRADKPRIVRLSRAGTLIGAAALGIASFVGSSAHEAQASSKPTDKTEKSSLPMLNSGICVPAFYIPKEGKVNFDFTMKNRRVLAQVDNAGQPVKDITDELAQSNEPIEVLDDDNTPLRQEKGLYAWYADYSVKVAGDPSQESLHRARYAQGQDETNSYRLSGLVNPDRLDGKANFSAEPTITKLIEVIDMCGVKTLRRAVKLEINRIISGFRHKKVANSEEKWAAEDCDFTDTVTTLVKVKKPEQPPPPKVDVPPTQEIEVPVQLPKKPVEVPVQLPKLPRTGDGSTVQQFTVKLPEFQKIYIDMSRFQPSESR